MLVGSIANVSRASAEVMLQVMPGSPTADAYIETVATSYAVRGDATAPTESPVATTEELERRSAVATMMPTVVRESKFLLTSGTGDFRCEGLAPGRYRVLALVPAVATTSGIYRSAGKTMPVTDYYTADFVVPELPANRKVVVRVAGFRRIGRSPAGI